MIKEPPTGIIRTLPPIYADPKHAACKNYQEAIATMAEDPEHFWFVALGAKPKHELLHVYILINGKIEARFTHAGYRDMAPGKGATLWDGTFRKVKAWAICAGPVSRPSSPIEMRGFRGFRYTQALW